MDIVMHLPDSPESMQNLREQTAAIYGEAILLYLQKLPCPIEQKLLLLDRLEQTWKYEKENTK